MPAASGSAITGLLIYPYVVCATTFPVGGIVTIPSGQLFEDWSTGNLWYINTATGKCSAIQKAPSGGVGGGYWGMAFKGTLVALINWRLQGLWTCTLTLSPTTQCSAVSAFIHLPSSFCASMPYGFCNPDGSAFDPKGNLWYADTVNGVEVELTKASGFTKVGVVNFFPYGIIGVVIDSAGNHWVIDNTCAGNLYKNGIFVGANGDDVDAITISTQNPTHTPDIYVTIANFCDNYAYPFIGNMSTMTILPSPYGSGADTMPGISTLLYFTDYSFDRVWLTTNKL